VGALASSRFCWETISKLTGTAKLSAIALLGVLAESVAVFPYLNHLWSKVVLEVVYVSIIASIARDEVRKISSAVNTGRLQGLRSHFLSSDDALGNWVSMLNVLFGAALVGIWVALVYQLDSAMADLGSLHQCRNF